MHRISHFAAIVFTAFISATSLMSCNKITSVPAETFEQKIALPGIQLVDVRTPEEYNSGHIAGAVNIDVNSPDFMSQATQELKKDKPVYVYCRSGKRSKKAGNRLAGEGYEVVDLDGGITDWKNSGLPVTDSLAAE